MDSGIIDSVKGLIEPVVDSMGFELVEVEFATDQRLKVLRLYVDKPGGINIDEITAVSREASVLLDVEDVVPGKYSLEVSSPGLNRALVKPPHFSAALGKKARIRLRESMNNRKNFQGIIKSVSGSKISFVDEAVGAVDFDVADIDKARLVVVL